MVRRPSRSTPTDTLLPSKTRFRSSQIGAITSRQSRVVRSREALDQRLADAQARYANREVPLPESWGGYCVVPRSEEHTSELQTLMRSSYAAFCFKKNTEDHQ